ncbi:MAG: tRNA uridine-5-carboxymethylaminomethyl(34) synthesis GTPase MnmE [Bacteroidales bacterium]|nr:tRNA uridine-5-carboxymethylaminomethyl(34) synthesis GTPase MnmE [Bacteroidales bacterium]
MYQDTNRTIVAPATGSGGAIAMIRVSGKDAFEIVGKIFKAKAEVEDNAKAEAEVEVEGGLGRVQGFRILYGEIIDSREIVDDVLVSVFRAPNSYTGEDQVEISCHASPYIQNKILQLLTENGASPARPGEFTQRAFLNGKMDLSQAEAVADVINSETEASHRLAMQQMRGSYSKEINELRDKMLHFASMIELELDFGEEDVEFADREEMRSMVKEIKSYTDSLRDSFKYGNAIKKGVPVAIVGKPNVGKSTLLNALLKDDKAIVSEIPGTTRDVIEDTIIIDGILFRFIDTAGIHETADVIENLGIRKTYQKIEQADIVLLLAEASDGAAAINKSFSEIRNQVSDTGKKLMLVINKTDLLDKTALPALRPSLECHEKDCIMLSATEGSGINDLILSLTGIIKAGYSSSQELIVTNLRHYEALKECSHGLDRVLNGLEEELPEDLIAVDLRQAIHYLGEITGEISTDEILGNIFKNFCIGK